MEISKENKNKKPLGRGLGSLLGGPQASAFSESAGTAVNGMTSQMTSQNEAQKPAATQQAQVVVEKIDDEKRVWSIAVDKLVPGQYQPRKKFDKETLQELAQSITENGILQPLVVRKRSAGGFEIIAGERRWRAAQIAGLHEVPAILKNIDDQEALQLALIENIQREDLDPIEEAESYQRLMEEFNLSQQQVAEKVGKERSTVANSLRLLALPFELKNHISDKLISVGHAKLLLSIDSKADQIKLAKQVAEKNLSVRALENLIKLNKGMQAQDASAEKVIGGGKADLANKLAQELAEHIQKALGTKATIDYKSGKGQINIHFYSDEQLNGIYEKLTK